MARGAVPVAPDWEVQRDLLDGGTTGWLVSLDEDDLCETLRVAVDDHEERAKKAAAGLERFRTHYASDVVAARLLGILDQVAA
ncbi:glycosyltransferase [Actinopolymorpha pittospori]